MKKKKRTGKLFALLFLLFGILLFASCKDRDEQTSDYYMYYLNQDRTGIERVAYTPDAQDTTGMIEEFIKKLSTQPKQVEYRTPLPEHVSIDRYEFKKGQLYLYFNKAYEDMNPTDEVLLRGAVVHTMMQVKNVSGVSFYVNNLPLTDASGLEVGIMNDDVFVENPGEEINNIQEADLKLYFASKDGEGLVRETQHVYYSGNMSIEKLTMERLFAGPESANALGTIPSGTKLISVSVLDGVCLVNLDEGFLVQNFKIKENVVIYSIVNSLTELPNVNTVQISVNGNTNIKYRETMPLKDYYKRNLDLVTGNGDDNVEVVQKQNKGE